MLSLFKLLGLGFFVGIADLIPGISGGTVAFLVGIYDDLLLHLKKFPSWPSIKFLLPLSLGMGSAIFSLASLLHRCLSNPLLASYLYALFFGLLVASTFNTSKHLRPFKLVYPLFLCCGAAIAFWIAGQAESSKEITPTAVYLFLSGAFAALALLLPGISGSYVLNLLGVYPLVMQSISSFWIHLDILLPLGLGILCGLLGSSFLVSFLLRHFRGVTFAFLTGCMMGGLRCVWPFYGSQTFLLICLSLLGFLFIFFLNRWEKRKLT